MATHIMRCRFIGLVHVMGSEVKDMGKVPYGIRARIERLEDHPRLGPPDNHDFTITSPVKLVDFQSGLIVTENSVYKFK